MRSWGRSAGSSLSQSDPDQAFLGALREIKKSAALLEADAVIGLRQTAVPLADGTGRFHVQLYGTAVREAAQADAAAGAAMNGLAAGTGQNILTGMGQTGRWPAMPCEPDRSNCGGRPVSPGTRQ